MPEDNLEQFGRGLSAPGGQQANAEELLAELVRLVQSPGFALKRPPLRVDIVPEKNLPASEPTHAPETGSLNSALDALFDEPKDTVVVAVEPPEPRKSGISYSNNATGIGLTAERRSGARTFGVAVIVLAGVALVGSIYGLGQIMSPPPRSFAAAKESPTSVSRNPNVAASSDPAGTPPKGITQPAESKLVSPEERPIDQSARDALEKAPPSQDLGSTAIGVEHPRAPPAQEPLAAPVKTPTAAEPATAPQASDSKAAAAAPPPPDPTPIPAPTPSATDSGVAAHASDAPLPPVRPTPKATVQAGAATTQRSAPKPDSPTKLSSQSGVHAVAKAGATGPGAPETKTLKSAQASVEPQAAPLTQPAPAPQPPSPNPVARAFGSVVGAVSVVTSLIPFAPH